MYNDYFGFTESPFSIAPDPRYLFMSDRHREALAHLMFGLRIDGGFVLLTGEVGTGKTTVCRCLLEQVPENCDVAFIFNPKLNSVELLSSICEELHIPVPDGRIGVKVFVDLLNFHLLGSNARGRKTVLIVDEAQNLTNEVLELLRLLTNLETNQRKLLQIILLGQPELRLRLAKPDMRQLAQRIVARYHLEPLSRPEVGAYVNYRLGVAGVRHALFPEPALERIYRLSHGTPRLINVICDRALLGAFVEGKPILDRATLDKAAREVLGAEGVAASRRSRLRWLAASVVGLALAAGLAALYQRFSPDLARVLGDTVVTAAPTASAVAPTSQRDDTPQLTQQARTPERASVTAGPIEWPAGKDHWLNEALAVRTLFKLWSVDVSPTGITEACAQAREQGMQCLQGAGDVAKLLSMNVPAIIGLHSASNADFFATLVALNENTAKLMVGGEERESSVDALRRQWSGSYTVLWRGPSAGVRELSLGSRGPEVAWVAQQLARLAGEPSPIGSEQFNAALRQKVLDFQRARGISADGVVGPITMARLAQTADPRTPTLHPLSTSK